MRLKLAYQLAEVLVLIYGIVTVVVTVKDPTSVIDEVLMLIKKLVLSKVNHVGYVISEAD